MALIDTHQAFQYPMYQVHRLLVRKSVKCAPLYNIKTPPYHEGSQRILIKEMIPLIKKKFGENLLALAAEASFARGEDTDYSDLELIAFVKELPGEKKIDGMRKFKPSNAFT